MKACAFVAAGEPETALVSAVAACRQARVRLEALVIALTSENLNHPANGVGAIQRRTRATYHFDTLDLLGGEKRMRSIDPIFN